MGDLSTKSPKLERGTNFKRLVKYSPLVIRCVVLALILILKTLQISTFCYQVCGAGCTTSLGEEQCHEKEVSVTSCTSIKLSQKVKVC